jgi:hypothetical protein
MTKPLIKEVYISVDVEADGPIPGDYSMTSLGASASGYMTSAGEIVTLDTSLPENQFYVEIKPISPLWVPEAFAVGLFTGFMGDDLVAKRDYIETTGKDPVEAMSGFADWVNGITESNEARTSIFAAYPLGYDWMWTYWYLEKFATTGSPFGHSRHIDIKTLYAAKASSMISRSIKSNIPSVLKPKTKHTHMALDDAIEQGELLINLLQWTKP